MEIEYKRELAGSYMCIRTGNDFLPFEKEMLKRAESIGVLPVTTVVKDNEILCRYEITGKQALDHVLESLPMDAKMLTYFFADLCGTLEQVENNLLNPAQLLLTQECIYRNYSDGSYRFCYCPDAKEEVTEAFQKLSEYLLTKIDHKDRIAVKIAYQIYDQVVKEGYSLTAIRESLHYGDEEGEEKIIGQDRTNVQDYEEKTHNVVNDQAESTLTESAKRIPADKSNPFQMIGKKMLDHFFPDIVRLGDYKKMKERKKEKQKEILPIVFEPEEEEVRMGRPTVLLSSRRNHIIGILKYEGDHKLPDLKIDTFPYLVGNSRECAGYLDCPTISRQHAKITKAEDVFFIEDLNSANGTKAGGNLLDYKMKVSLEPNEVVEFADEKFRFI